MGNKVSTPTESYSDGRSSRYSASPTEGEEPRRSAWLPRPTAASSSSFSSNSGAAALAPAAGTQQQPRGGVRSAAATPRASNNGGVRDSRGYESEEDLRGVERPAEMSWYQMAKVGYQELVNAIIRPPRAEYEIESLGPVQFEFVGKVFKRDDFQLRNERGHRLECSHWQPHGWQAADRAPCIVYMHGNSSARLEALPQLTLALSLGATLVAFDFSGSGLSGGEYVSLGYYEKDDVKVVIDHLRRSGTVGAIALWGRSMGAATALLHADRDMSIAALVLDSAFADLTQLAEEMVERGRQAGLTVPGMVAKMVMRMIRGTVIKTAGFNVRDLCPIAHADRTFIPALFIAGRGDDFIKPHHSQQIHDMYAGDKNIVLVEGDHNSPRPSFLFDSVYIFLQNYLQVPLEWGLDRSSVPMGYPPWYLRSATRGAGGRRVPDLSDFMDWDPAVAATFGVEGVAESGVERGGAEGLGMTPATPQEIQAALFHMLAQERNRVDRREADNDVETRLSPGPSDTVQRSTVLRDRRQQQQQRAARHLPSPPPPHADAIMGEPLLSNGYRNDHMNTNNSRDAAMATAIETGRYGPDGTILWVNGNQDGSTEGGFVAAHAGTGADTAVASERTWLSGSPGGGGGDGSGPHDFYTPSAVERPVLAPFSVSDTSSQATASPDNYRRLGIKFPGGGRGSAGGNLEVSGGGGGESPHAPVSPVSEEGGLDLDGNISDDQQRQRRLAGDEFLSTNDVMLLTLAPSPSAGGDGGEERSSPRSATQKGPLHSSSSGGGGGGGGGGSGGHDASISGSRRVPLKGRELTGSSDGVQRTYRNGDGRIFRSTGGFNSGEGAGGSGDGGEKGHMFRSLGGVSGKGRGNRDESKGHIFRDLLRRRWGESMGGEDHGEERLRSERGGRIFRHGAATTSTSTSSSSSSSGAATTTTTKESEGRRIFRDDESRLGVGKARVFSDRGGAQSARGSSDGGGIGAGRASSVSLSDGGGGGGVGVLSDRGRTREGGSDRIVVNAFTISQDAGEAAGRGGGGAARAPPIDMPPAVGDDGLSSIVLAAGEWSCSRCTLINATKDQNCLACGGTR